MTETTSEAELVIAPNLAEALSDLGREYGPLGVALAAARMTSVDALVQRLIGPSVKNTDVSSPTDKGHMGAPMTDRITLPASVIEDARAHPEKYRPEVEAGDRVLVVNGTLGSDGLIGTVMAKSVQVTGDPVIGISGGGTTHTVFGWLRVGGVEQGPRPEVGGRVLVLDVHLPSAEVLVGQIGRVDFVGYDATDRLGPLVVFTEPDGTEHRTRVTEWAVLPEDHGMGEATARRTVGSLNADDIEPGKRVQVKDIQGEVIGVSHWGGTSILKPRTELLFVDVGVKTFHPDTPCRVSDGPGETT